MKSLLFIAFQPRIQYFCRQFKPKHIIMTLLSILAAGYWLLIGSFSDQKSEGLSVFDYEPQSGETTHVSGLTGIPNPSFLCVSADRRHVYAVAENNDETSGACAMRFDPARGTLHHINRQQAYGGSPAFIAIAPDGSTLVTANYFGGNLTSFALKPDGAIQPGQVFQFEGSSVNPKRQTKPYLHSVYFTPDGKYMWCNDLGTDNIRAFPLSSSGTPLIADSLLVSHFIRPGLGPRHLCFASDGETAYVLGELSGEVCRLRYLSDGSIRVYQVLQADSLGAGGSADIHLSPDGKFLYTSHRLQGDGLSIIRILDDGTMQKIAYQPTGAHPRNFAISPDGRYVLVACRDTDEVELYARNQQTGLLTDTGRRIPYHNPSCLIFVPKE